VIFRTYIVKRRAKSAKSHYNVISISHIDKLLNSGCFNGMTANVLQLGEVADFGAQNCLTALNLIRNIIPITFGMI
jgi:hypothetical protein